MKLILLSALLNTNEGNIYATPPSDPPKIERRRMGKGKRDRRRGGSGLR